MTDTSLGPLPKTLTGGCLCGAVRYRVNFPPDHDFTAHIANCQCTQCRKQSGSVLVPFFRVPTSAIEWLSPGIDAGTGLPAALKTYAASPEARRGFCGTCGSFLYWHLLGRESFTLTVGTVDALYLFGEGAGGEGEAADVPPEGFGKVIASGRGTSDWCENEIKGVTDDMPLLFRGKRSEKD